MGMMVEVKNEAVIRLEMVWVSNGCDVVEYYYLIQQVDVCVLSFFRSDGCLLYTSPSPRD